MNVTHETLEKLITLRRAKSEHLLSGEREEVRRLQGEVQRLEERLDKANVENIELRAYIALLEGKLAEKCHFDQIQCKAVQAGESKIVGSESQSIESDGKGAEDQEEPTQPMNADAPAFPSAPEETDTTSGLDAENVSLPHTPRIILPAAAQNTKWLKLAFDDLNSDLGPQYLQLMRLWIRVESLHLNDPGKRMTHANRPQVLSDWINAARRPLKSKANNEPWIGTDDVERFTKELRQWWDSLSKAGDFNFYGKNGWYTLLIGVKWWGTLVVGGADSTSTTDWSAFIEKVTEALETCVA